MKLRTFLVILVAIALLLAAISLQPSLAQDSPQQIAQQLSQKPNCNNPATTSDMNLCSTQESQAADKKLNQVYQQLKPKLSSKQQQRLTNAQVAWIKFKNDSCDYERSQFEGGSLAPSTYGYCIARVTQQRISDLERYLQQAQL